MESSQSSGKRLLDCDGNTSNKRRKGSQHSEFEVSPSGSRLSFCDYLGTLNPCRRRKREFYPLPALKVKSPCHRIVYIMRGPPGCGKSTAARSLWAKHLQLGGVTAPIGDKSVPEPISRAFIFSTDDYFTRVDESGHAVYDFDPKKIGSNHEKNQQRCENAMELGISPLFVDNTNISLWEMRAYVVLADRFGYEIAVIDPHSLSPQSFDVDTLVRRCENSRSRASGKFIPRNVFQRMVDNFMPLPTSSESSDPLDAVRAAKGPERRKATPKPPPPRYAGLDVESQTLAAIGSVELGKAFWQDRRGGHGNYLDARSLQDTWGAFGAESLPEPFNIPARLHVTVKFFGDSDSSLEESVASAEELVGMEYIVVISTLIFIRGGELLCAPCSILDQNGELPLGLQALASDSEEWRPHITLLTSKGGAWRPKDSIAVLKAWEDAVLRESTNAACESSPAAIAASDPYEEQSMAVLAPSDVVMDSSDQVNRIEAVQILDEASVNEGIAVLTNDCSTAFAEISEEALRDLAEPDISIATSLTIEETPASPQNESAGTTIIDPSDSPTIMEAIRIDEGTSTTCEAFIEAQNIPSELDAMAKTTLNHQPSLSSSGGASGTHTFSDVSIHDTLVDLCAIHLPAPIVLTSCAFRLFWK